MRRRLPLLLVLGLLAAASLTPARAGALLVSAASERPLMSSNVTYVGTIPIEAIGGRMLKVGNQMRFYVTGAPGLVIYDVTNPALPVPLGTLPLPHFQNEDVDVSDDGKRVILSTDTVQAGTTPSSAAAGTGSIRVIDTSNPQQPKVVGYIASGNHTTTCADAACNWLYGSGGAIYDARDAANIKQLPKGWKPGGGGGHALNRDASGLLVSDSTPRHVLDVTNPAAPVSLASGSASVKLPDGLLQHNNVRPNADKWVPRDPASADYNDPAMRPGELLIGNSESNVRNQCGQNAGGLSTWSMVNFDQTKKIVQKEIFRPVNGNWVDGNPAVNALGCSGHWFTVRNNMIAASWYEHGVRFIEVDPATGKFTQKGFYQPVVTQAGSAHWVTDAAGNEYVYTTDYARGIDILKFNRAAPAPSEAEITNSWLANLGKVGPAAQAEREQFRAAAHG